jgi:hypothetical protein
LGRAVRRVSARRPNAQKVVTAFEGDQILWFRPLGESRLESALITKLIVFGGNEQLGSPIVSQEARGCGQVIQGKDDAYRTCYLWLQTCSFQYHLCTERNA